MINIYRSFNIILQALFRSSIRSAGPQFAMLEGMGSSLLTMLIGSAHDSHVRRSAAHVAVPRALPSSGTDGPDMELLMSFLDREEASEWQAQFNLDSDRQRSTEMQPALSQSYLRSDPLRRVTAA